MKEPETMRRIRVYISGPITKGNRNYNYFIACEAEAELMRRGFAPLNPMQTMVLPFAWDGEFPHAKWLERDFAWIAVSDAILRLPGESVGAEQECEFARSLGIPVVMSIDQLPTACELYLRAALAKFDDTIGAALSAAKSGSGVE